jgi:Tfp pilus assembly protein PilF
VERPVRSALRAAAVMLAVMGTCLRAEEDLAKLARAYLDQGNCASAVEYFEAALAKKPGVRDIRVLCAFAFSQTGKNEKAAELLTRELELFPKSKAAWILLGLVY